MSLNRNEKAAVISGCGRASGSFADAGAGRVPWPHRRTPEQAAPRARDIGRRVPSRAEEHAGRRAVIGTPFEVAAESMAGPLIYGFSEDAAPRRKSSLTSPRATTSLVVRVALIRRRGAGCQRGQAWQPSQPRSTDRPGGRPAEVADPATGRRRRCRGREEGWRRQAPAAEGRRRCRHRRTSTVSLLNREINMAFDKDAFLAAMDSMSVMELNDLVKAIEEKFGVSAAAMAARPLGLRRCRRRRGRREDRVQRRPARGRRQQGLGHQGRARTDRPGPEGSQGPGRRRSEARQEKASPRPTPKPP